MENNPDSPRPAPAPPSAPPSAAPSAAAAEPPSPDMPADDPPHQDAAREEPPVEEALVEDPTTGETIDFTPIRLRARMDGWTPHRQIVFIQLLSECGCAVEAARGVGMSVEGAYRLCRRPDAQSFRLAWEIAMDNAVRRLSDVATSRSIHGVPVPHYFNGEKVGEHRRFDERLTMFILRNRDRNRYGDAIAKQPPDQHPERIAVALADALRLVIHDAFQELKEEPRTFVRDLDEDEQRAAQASRDWKKRCES